MFRRLNANRTPSPSREGERVEFEHDSSQDADMIAAASEQCDQEGCLSVLTHDSSVDFCNIDFSDPGSDSKDDASSSTMKEDRSEEDQETDNEEGEGHDEEDDSGKDEEVQKQEKKKEKKKKGKYVIKDKKKTEESVSSNNQNEAKGSIVSEDQKGNDSYFDLLADDEDVPDYHQTTVSMSPKIAPQTLGQDEDFC